MKIVTEIITNALTFKCGAASYHFQIGDQLKIATEDVIYEGTLVEWSRNSLTIRMDRDWTEGVLLKDIKCLED